MFPSGTCGHLTDAWRGDVRRATSCIASVGKLVLKDPNQEVFFLGAGKDLFEDSTPACPADFGYWLEY